jgi:hypothetical protein
MHMGYGQAFKDPFGGFSSRASSRVFVLQLDIVRRKRVGILDRQREDYALLEKEKRRARKPAALMPGW